jgi:CheY-like chemotaxis protein
MMFADTTAQSRRPLRILLVEDDPIHARIIRRAIGDHSSSGDVTHVTDGKPAIQILLGETRDRYPDLVLLDLQLPDTNGFEVLAAVKRSDAAHRVPVVVISSYDLPDDVARSYDLGANAYIVKPADFASFVDDMAVMYRFWGTVVQMPRH